MKRLTFFIACSCVLAGLSGCSDDGDGVPIGPVPMGGTGGVSGGGGSGGSTSGAGGTGAVTGGQNTGGVPAGAGGSGGTAVAQPVAPTMNGSRYSFASGELVFEVDPAVGGRVTTLALGGVNLLTGPEVNPLNWGSTFWVAPQSAWGWPPPVEIDSSPYTGAIEGTHVVMTSPPSPTLGVTIRKDFAVESSGWITLTYTITASGSAPVSFFPTGADPVAAPATEGGGATWLATSGVTAEGKYAADGSGGWLAHLQGDLLLIKQFADEQPTSIAPGQKEVELYTKPPAAASGYEEVEVHGRYSTLAPGTSATWQVKWLLSRVPAGTAVEPGSAALVALVDSLVP